jgi:hypothetical protein
MKRTLAAIIAMALFASMWWAMILLAHQIQPGRGQTYDCSLAEFHPDYPLEVKRKCREIRKGSIT